MDQKSGKPSQKRRAILQGSLAAPVVLTVTSPTAAASSFARCIRNLPDEPPSVPRFLETWDGKGWWRVEVDVVRFVNGGDNKATEWLYMDPNKQGYVRVDDPFSTELPNIPGGWLPQYDKRWLLAWFDDQGRLGPYQVQKPSLYKASTVSCHTSFTSGSGR